jgi:hypothetical protein
MKTEPVDDYDEPKGTLQAFLECCGMGFWQLGAEQTYQK